MYTNTPILTSTIKHMNKHINESRLSIAQGSDEYTTYLYVCGINLEQKNGNISELAFEFRKDNNIVCFTISR